METRDILFVVLSIILFFFGFYNLFKKVIERRVAFWNKANGVKTEITPSTYLMYRIEGVVLMIISLFIIAVFTRILSF